MDIDDLLDNSSRYHTWKHETTFHNMHEFDLSISLKAFGFPIYNFLSSMRDCNKIGKV